MEMMKMKVTSQPCRIVSSAPAQGEKLEPGHFALTLRQNSYGNCHAISSYREVLEHSEMQRPEVIVSDGTYYVDLPGYKEILVYKSIPDSAVAITKDPYARLVLKALDDAKRREYPNMDKGGGASPSLDLKYLTGLKSTSSKRGSVDDGPPSGTLRISDASVDALVVSTKQRLFWFKKLTSKHAYAVHSIDKANQKVTLTDTDGSLVTVSFHQFDQQVDSIDRLSQMAVVTARKARLARVPCTMSGVKSFSD